MQRKRLLLPLRLHRDRTIFRILTLALLGLSACASTATASGQADIVSEFELSCIAPEQAGQTSVNDDITRGWVRVERDAHAPLAAYTGLVFTLLEDKLGPTSHFKKNVNGKDFYLIRYSYDGLYNQTAYNCLISDFDRDSWQFPAGFENWIDGKLKVNAFSSVELEDHKTVGNWQTQEILQPVNKVHLTAIPKNGLDAQSGGFYGTILQSIRMEETQTTEKKLGN